MGPRPLPASPYFNSRSCEGATHPRAVGAWPVSISTHAPVKERRRRLLKRAPFRRISTHAPVKERQRKSEQEKEIP